MSVPTGAVLVRIYYSVPDGYTIGKTFDDRTEALIAALEEWAAVVTDMAISPPVVDERWVLASPPGHPVVVDDVVFQRDVVWPQQTRDVVGTQARRTAADQAIQYIRRNRELVKEFPA